MSEAIDLGFIGSTLRTIQAEQRSLRGDVERLDGAVSRLRSEMLTRADFLDAVNILVARIANFEALTETRLDVLTSDVGQRLDAQQTRFNERVDAQKTHIDERLDLLGFQIGQINRQLPPE